MTYVSILVSLEMLIILLFLQMEMTLMTARTPLPRPTEMLCKGTANLMPVSKQHHYHPPSDPLWSCCVLLLERCVRVSRDVRSRSNQTWTAGWWGGGVDVSSTGQQHIQGGSLWCSASSSMTPCFVLLLHCCSTTWSFNVHVSFDVCVRVCVRVKLAHRGKMVWYGMVLWQIGKIDLQELLMQ